jgi:membrane protein required for colicin V production
MKFSSIDIFLIAGLAIGGFLGYRGGPVKKLFNLLMFLLAVVLAAKFMQPVGSFFSDSGVLSETGGLVAGFTLVMLAVMIPAIFLYRKFGKTGIGKSTTSMLGVFLGIVEGALIISFILLGLKIFDTPDEETRRESLLYKPMANIVPKTFDLLESYFPGASGLKEEMTKHFKQIQIFEPASRHGRSL